jgi:UDP-3-O-[3-hydroxymyristoyl] glucosamine N-acyltransferase
MGLRQRLAERRFKTDIGRLVRPSRFAAYGDGTVLHPPVAVDHPDRVAFGAQTFVLAGATIAVGPAGSVQVGARTYLGRDLTIIAMGSLTIGDDVMGSDRLLFSDTAPAPTTAGVPVRDQELAPPRPIVIEDGVFLGTGAMVLAGVTVGARSLIGAGAVVTQSVPPNCVVVGNPARVVRWFDHAIGTWVDGAPSGAGEVRARG